MLQKKSNRYLQQPFPENLMPRKPLGKRERFRPRSRTVFKNYVNMEEEMCNQWVFSWNTQAGLGWDLRGRCSAGKAAFWRVPLLALINGSKDNMYHMSPGKGLIPPSTHLLNLVVSAGLGGKLVQHLNESASTKDTGEVNSIAEPTKGPSNNLSPAAAAERGGLVAYAPYKIKSNEEGISVAEYVFSQVKSGYLKTIYSINERAKMGKREARIGDYYKNQLTERKKVSILYGNISKRALCRALDQAKEGGGDLESNFFSLLERRLDVSLKRALFFPTIESARHWIHRGKILVNKQPCTSPAYLLQPADMISISSSARDLWRREWLQFFGRIFPKNFPWKLDKEKENNPVATRLTFPLLVREGGGARRFSFSPQFMQKWNRWSVIWGNSPCYARSPSRRHRWLEKKLLGKVSPGRLHFSFATASAFAHYFQHNAVARRYFALEMRHIDPMGAYEKAFMGKKDLSYLAHRHETKVSRWIGGVRDTPLGITSNKEESRRSSSIRERWVDQGRWLQQERASVVDGLYAYRWNKVFARKKGAWEKLMHRRWSSLKPLHLECSYKNCSAVFLYAPQKLAWPNSINVSLLRKAFMR